MLNPRTADRFPAALPVAIALLCAGLLACDQASTAKREWRPSDHGQPRGAPPPGGAVAPPPADKQGGEALAARSLWNVTCASCHGPDGRGGGAGLPPGAKPPDLRASAFQGARTDAAIAKMIRQGQGLMPGFGKQIGDAGIRALVAHVRSLAAPAAAKVPDAGVEPGSAKPTRPAAP